MFAYLEGRQTFEHVSIWTGCKIRIITMYPEELAVLDLQFVSILKLIKIIVNQMVVDLSVIFSKCMTACCQGYLHAWLAALLGLIGLYWKLKEGYGGATFMFFFSSGTCMLLVLFFWVQIGFRGVSRVFRIICFRLI